MGSCNSRTVGSIAVVAVMGPGLIVVANCGDSRAVLSHAGEAVPLSTDHKKDRASVLDNTKDYLSALKSQISDVERKNPTLEMRLLPPDETSGEEAGDPSERVSIQIIRSRESSSRAQQIELTVTVRVECDMIELVLNILEDQRDERH